MTYEEFIKKIKQEGVDYQAYLPSEDYSDEGDLKYIVDMVETGGHSGGSCWEDSNPMVYSTSNSLGRFENLSKVVRATMPDISFMEYEGVLDLVKRDDHTDYEYYGNSTQYACQYVELKELYLYLSDIGKWKN